MGDGRVVKDLDHGEAIASCRILENIFKSLLFFPISPKAPSNITKGFPKQLVVTRMVFPKLLGLLILSQLPETRSQCYYFLPETQLLFLQQLQENLLLCGSNILNTLKKKKDLSWKRATARQIYRTILVKLQLLLGSEMK